MENDPGTKNGKLWTRSFLILLQAQFVSSFGDAVYGIALGFWVLAVTGSTALMGTLMAASTLPGVLIASFAGTFIDRHNKKRLVVLMDFIRGVSVVLLAAAAYRGLIAIWMVFAAGILLSLCGAVFSPGVSSAIPDLVPKAKLTNANSAVSGAATGSNMIGSSAGGFLYQACGAPFLFLLNGVSFLFSGISLLFVTIPNSTAEVKQHFLKDMTDGFRFMWRFKGLRYILIMAGVINFFSFIGIVLLMPLFQKTAYLGAGRYGVAMACFMGGIMAGYVVSAIVHYPSRIKLALFIASMITVYALLIVAVNQRNFIFIPFLLIIAGFFNTIVNVMLIASTQAATPPEMRGKVMALMSMLSQGLTPLGQAFGGVLGGFFPIRLVISAAFLAGLVLCTPFYFFKAFRVFIRFDPSKDDPDSLI
jgi:Arabinose efflux permease